MKPIALLAADLHIRASAPESRIDDYFNTQFHKFDFICSLASKYHIPIIEAGDLGDKSHWTNILLRRFIEIVYKYDVDILVVPGQHDLPHHRLDMIHESGIGVLHEDCTINVITGYKGYVWPDSLNPSFYISSFPWGSSIENIERKEGLSIAVAHQLVIENNLEWPGQVANKATDLLKKNFNYDLILTGDNHNPFICEYEGRLLVNPGSMCRMKSNQKDHKPRVYLWYDNNTVQPIYLPIENNVINISSNKEEVEILNEKIQILIDKINADSDISLSFEDNLNNVLINRDIPSRISSIINNFIEDIKGDK